MDYAFFGTDPAELTVGDEVAPCLSPIRDEGGERAPFNAVGDVVNSLADNIVAAADGEGLGEGLELVR